MGPTRTSAFAGSLYPANAVDLRKQVDAAVRDSQPSDIQPLAVIAPHARNQQAGSVAASAHSALGQRDTPIDRVVIAGPAHTAKLNGVAVSSASRFSSPLGGLDVDTDAVADLCRMDRVDVSDRLHNDEYSIEIQLPFIQHLIGDVAIVPLLVGSGVRPTFCADVLERLWRDDRTAVIVSSDLSHHNPIDQAQEIDSTTSKLISRLDLGAIDTNRMCGAGAARGLMKVARRRHLKPHTLDVRSSTDAGGDPDRVVGYGAYAFTAAATEPLTAESQAALIELAEASARRCVTGDQPIDVARAGLPSPLSERGAAFVSVKVGDELRGCIGRIEPTTPLAENVAWAAGEAVAGRAWFTPVSPSALADMTVEVHVLSPLERIHASSEDELARALQPGADGLVLVEGQSQATYLPSVWETISEPESFIAGLVAKGQFDHPWSNGRAAYRYSTIVIRSST